MMDTQNNIIRLLLEVQSQCEPLFSGESRVQLEMSEDALTIFVIDTEENVMYPTAFDDSDDFVNQEKLIDEIMANVKSEQIRCLNEDITFRHEHVGE